MPASPPFSVVFTRGVDTRNDARLVASPYLRTAQNVYFENAGGPKKRNGYQILPSAIQGGGTLKATGVSNYKNELLAFDDLNVYSWSPSIQQWVPRTPCIPTTTSIRPVVTNAFTQTWCDHATNGVWDVWVYQDNRATWTTGTVVNPRVYYSVMDRATGAYLVYDQTLTTTGAYPRVVATRSGFLFFYTDISIAGVGGHVITSQPMSNTAVPTLGASVRLANDLIQPNNGYSWNYCYDVAFDGTTAVLVYEQNSSGLVRFLPLTDLGALATLRTCTYLPQNFSNPFSTSSAFVSVTPDALRPGYFLLALAYNNGWATFAYNAIGGSTSSVTSGTESATGTQINQIVCTSDAAVPGAAYVAYSYNLTGVANQANTHTVPVAFAATPPLATLTLNQFALLSRPFAYQGRLFAYVGLAQQAVNAGNTTASTTSQPTVYVYCFTTQTLVAVIAYGNGDYNAWAYTTVNPSGQYQVNFLPSVTSPSVGAFEVALKKQLSVTSVNGMLATQSNFFQYGVTFCGAQNLQSSRMGDSRILAGGIVQVYDGAQVVEHGFLAYPEMQGVITSSSVGGGASVGTVWQYCAVWEWIDAQGQLYRSSPSPAVTVTAVSPGSGITTGFSTVLTFSPIVATNKRNVTLAIYRTTNAGQVFYRLPTPPVSSTASANATISYNDTTLDSQLQGNAILYTVGGELQNDPPPACQFMTASKNRIFIAGGEDADVITYTKQYVKNAGTSFSLAFQTRVSAIPGAITGMASMDDKIVIFKNPGILYFYGSTGPSVSGANNDFSTPPQIITREIGCISAHSIISTADGIYFQSLKGMWLLDRGLNLTFVGEPMYGYRNQTVVSAEMMPSNMHIRFGCASDPALIYHYRQQEQFSDSLTCGQWTTYTNYAQKDATIWQNNYAFARADGAVCVENSGYLDGTEAIRMVLTTAWLKSAGILDWADFQELGILGSYSGPHQLRIDMFGDYRSAPWASLLINTLQGITTTTWGTGTMGAPTVWGADSDDVYAFRGQLPVQTACIGVVAFTISDEGLPGVPLQNSVNILGLEFTGQSESGLARLGVKKFIG